MRAADIAPGGPALIYGPFRRLRVYAYLESRRVNLDMPQHMIAKLDTHARRRGVTRQALIKMWLADRLAETKSLGSGLWGQDYATSM